MITITTRKENGGTGVGITLNFRIPGILKIARKKLNSCYENLIKKIKNEFSGSEIIFTKIKKENGFAFYSWDENPCKLRMKVIKQSKKAPAMAVIIVLILQTVMLGNFLFSAPIVSAGDGDGSISGYKFNDLNQNGDWDDGEEGLSDWEIILEGGGIDKRIVITDNDGYYEFLDLDYATYRVYEGENANKKPYQQTRPEPDYPDYIVYLQSNHNQTDKNFGNYFPVCGNGFLDTGFNGYDEQCDDGNNDDEAGCSSICQIEACDDNDEDGICDDVDNCPINANPEQEDADEDGVGDVCDCDDNDDSVWRTGFFYYDGDGDGYRSIDGLIEICYGEEIPNGYTEDDLPEDCNDGDENINPGADEICDDGFDNDCNGDTDCDDEDCNGDPACTGGDDPEPECTNGDQGSCYSGAKSTQGIGICCAGIQTCTAGKWGDCEGEVLPKEEICDGLDNNCNDETDEGGVCDTEEEQKSSGGGGYIAGLTISAESVKSSDVSDISEEVSMKITWTTSQFSTSAVIYDTEPGKFNQSEGAPNYGCAYSKEGDDSGLEKVTGHSVTLTGLKPDTVYYYHTISSASPPVFSGEYEFTTGEAPEPKQEESAEEEKDDQGKVAGAATTDEEEGEVLGESEPLTLPEAGGETSIIFILTLVIFGVGYCYRKKLA